jgi:hypothetical protein
MKTRKLIQMLFSPEMARANMEGRKTETRRIVKPASGWDVNWHVAQAKDSPGRYCMRCGTQYSLPYFKCPYGEPGDVMWMREGYVPHYFDGGTHGYMADWNSTAAEYVKQPKWKPNIHMPLSACRFFAEISEVRVERLQDISQEEARNEGTYPAPHRAHHECKQWKDPMHNFRDCFSCGYKLLWIKINGGKSWIENPWVWVVKYRRLAPVELLQMVHEIVAGRKVGEDLEKVYNAIIGYYLRNAKVIDSPDKLLDEVEAWVEKMKGSMV